MTGRTSIIAVCAWAAVLAAAAARSPALPTTGPPAEPLVQSLRQVKPAVVAIGFYNPRGGPTA